MTSHNIWQYCHTHFVLKTKLDTKTALSDFFIKNAQHHPLDYLYSITVWVKDIIYKLKLD